MLLSGALVLFGLLFSLLLPSTSPASLSQLLEMKPTLFTFTGSFLLVSHLLRWSNGASSIAMEDESMEWWSGDVVELIDPYDLSIPSPWG